jgi:hypothetical protein
LLRKTQTTEYWRELTLDDPDLIFLGDLFLEKEIPLTLDELTLALIRHRSEMEETALRKELAQGKVYQPKENYAIGARLVFPALDFASGKVIDSRPGHNPEYGDFTVIKVAFEQGDDPLEFASQLTAPHPLNFDGGEDALLRPQDMLTPEELFELYGPSVKQKLRTRLEANPDMVHHGDLWFNKAMMAEIHLGHLNIAEAMIDIQGKPLSTQALLRELDLPDEVPQSVQVYSLEYAISQDERFVDVGTPGEIRWYLVRLLPPEVIHPPRRLQYAPIPHDRSLLTEELLQVERELDDEASDLIAPPGMQTLKSMTLVLTYPHRRVGTLPLTAQTSSFFPPGTVQHTQIALVDANTGREMPAWVNHQHRYVYGLEKWYQEHGIPVGAYIELKRTDDPLQVSVGFRPRRMRREWVRVAEPAGDNLNFTVRKMPIACEYDETMLVWADDSVAVDELWIRIEETNKPLGEIIQHVFGELAKLNPQGTVHAKTLYSAVNVARRCPPAPIFAELVRDPVFFNVGDAHWRYVE